MPGAFVINIRQPQKIETNNRQNQVMNKDKLIGFLQSTGLVQLKTAEAIATNFEFKDIKKNEYFLKEGKVSNEYLFLASGFMRAFALKRYCSGISSA